MMGYVITAMVAFAIGMLLSGSVIYWYQKEFSYSYCKFTALFQRLCDHKNEILSTVEQRRWWETLFDDLDRAGAEMDKAAKRFNL